MKVFEVSTWNVRCGIGTYTSYLGQALKEQGHEVKILAEKASALPGNIDPDFPNKDIPSVECWNRYESFENLLKIVEEEKPDIVHIQHQFGLFPYVQTLKQLLEGLKSKTKILLTLHDVTPFDYRMEEYFNCFIKYSDAIIVHNETCKQLLLHQWNCPESKIHMIYHGTKLIEVPSKIDARTKLNLPQDSKVVLSWGFLWESKGITELVEIFAQILKKYPNSIFIHAGGLHPLFNKKDYLEAIFKKAFALGIRPTNFKITGFVKEQDVPVYFGAANVIVLNYMRGSASASGAAHRAVASGRPIVGTDDPCIQEIPKHTVERFNKQSLLKGVLEVLENSEIQNKLIEEEMKFAQSTSWKNTASRHIMLMDKLLG